MEKERNSYIINNLPTLCKDWIQLFENINSQYNNVEIQLRGDNSSDPYVRPKVYLVVSYE